MKDWLSQLDPKWVATNVIGWGFLAAVLGGVFFYMILPTQEHSFEMQGEIITVQKDIAATLSRQTPILEDIRRNTSK